MDAELPLVTVDRLLLRLGVKNADSSVQLARVCYWVEQHHDEVDPILKADLLRWLDEQEKLFT